MISRLRHIFLRSFSSDNKSPIAMEDKESLRKRLTPLQYKVTQESFTEYPFTSEYTDHHESGIYNCVVCGVQLFSSQSKFNSGCGWPAFDAPMDANQIKNLHDSTHGMQRTEVRCQNCDAHLGHVFDDGPTATGIRYCINGASLQFTKK
ncbi:unnamed protein product [Blepharisma stoltei]|uniref:Peptide-methionine (R)-S-oxide reductase n=1 Tax=Blepharisma stoltei TaxID=1481888 RepID=A0AAU9JWE0_9CILI|nr:unnamed protein product [Blepharisma stoltei]